MFALGVTADANNRFHVCLGLKLPSPEPAVPKVVRYPLTLRPTTTTKEGIP